MVVLVGYELGLKGYQLWDRHTHSLRLSWDVTFDESVFPFLQGAKPHPAPESPAPISAQAPIIIRSAFTAPNQPAQPPVVPLVSTPVLLTGIALVLLPTSPPSPAPSEDSEKMVQGLLCTESEQCASESAPVHNVENADTPQQSTPLPPSSPPSLIPSTPEHQPATEQPLPRCTRALCVVRPAAALVSEPRHLGHTPVPNPGYFNKDNVAQHGQ